MGSFFAKVPRTTASRSTVSKVNIQRPPVPEHPNGNGEVTISWVSSVVGSVVI